VHGDFVMDSRYGGYDSHSHSSYYYYNGDWLTAGTLEVKGDFTQLSSNETVDTSYIRFFPFENFQATGTHKVVLSGDDGQSIYFEDPADNKSHFNILEVRNNSNDGVVFDSTYVASELYTFGNKMSALSIETQDFVLQDSHVIDGDLLLKGKILNLNGHTLTVEGSLTQSAGIFTANGGTLIVKGDYRIQAPDEESSTGYTFSSGIFRMENASDYILVHGDFVMDSRYGGYDSHSHSSYYYYNGDWLTAGTLEVKGDFTQLSSNETADTSYIRFFSFENFQATNTHKVVLSGNAIQHNNFEDPTTSYFNIVEYINDQGNIVVNLDSDGDDIPDFLDSDDDNDGMSDAFENLYGFDPFLDSDAALDSDNDGLTNLEEFLAGTDPTNSDTDNDGTSDGEDSVPLDPEVGGREKLNNDFDGNGLGDILLRHDSTNQWYLYGLNNDLSIDSFGGVGLTADDNWQTQAIGHLNNDDYADVLMRRVTDGMWYQFTLDGNRGVTGDVGFVAQLPVKSDYAFKALADFDGDGLSDVLMRNTDNGSWWLYRLDGNRGVSSYRGLGITANQDWVFEGVADLNSDGVVDVLLRHQTSNGWYAFHLDNTGAILSSSGGLGVSKDAAWQLQKLVDMSYDGVVDLLLQNTDTYAYQVVGLNTNRTEKASHSYMFTSGIPQDEHWELQQVADYNQDGKADMLLRHKGDGRWKGFLLNGEGDLVAGSSNVAMTRDIDWQVVPSEQLEEELPVNNDFNGDGIPDVLMRNTSGAWWVNHLNGNRGLAANTGGIAMTSNTDYQLQAKADFNGDGFEDVLVRNTSTGTWFMYHLNGNRGFAANSGGVGLSTNLDWEFKAAQDFNGDGNIDILMRNSSTGGWWLYHMNGARGLAAGSGGLALTSNAAYAFKAAKDFNGDGNTDVLVRNTSTGTWYLYHLNGNRGFAAGSGGIAATANQDYAFKAAEDFNGDGNMDVLVRNTSTGTWFLYHLNGNRGFAAGSGGLPLTNNSAWAFKAANDFNGDGNMDVLIRNSNGAWYLYHLNGGRGFASGSGGVGMTTHTRWTYQ